MKYPLYLLVILFMFSAQSAYAQLTIDITRGNMEPIPVAFTQFETSAANSKDAKEILSVIENNLKRSGLFRSVNPASFIEKIKGVDAVPQFANWRHTGAQALFMGTLTQKSDGSLEASFRLWDVLASKQLVGRSFASSAKAKRRIGHLISDAIYKALTGEEGYFDSRIVYVSETGNKKLPTKRLAIMDQDGANNIFLTKGDTLVLTPRFHPDSQTIIYMDYMKRRPRVYLYDIERGKKILLGDFDGMSFAPRFSPDGDRAVLSASENGNIDIFEVSLGGFGSQKRLTNDPSIDTSPSYSPDGKRIVFTSDRGGKPALYVMNRDGSGVTKISKGDGEYTTPVWSPRGDWIAFTKMKGGQFHIGVMRPDGNGERLLTKSYLDESPTWSPNGRVIIFARETGPGAKSGIYSIDLTGYNLRRISTSTEASDPAWGPILGK